jgi:hypothetical protein
MPCYAGRSDSRFQMRTISGTATKMTMYIIVVVLCSLILSNGFTDVDGAAKLS